MRSLLPGFLISLAALPCFGATFTVSNNMDTGPGSFRDALTMLNGSSDPSNTINFDASYIVTLFSSLPLITKTVTINGNASTVKGNALSSSLTFQPALGAPININSLAFQGFLTLGGEGGTGGINSGDAMLGGGGGGGAAALGGALLFLSGNATLNTVSLSNNIAKGGSSGSATMTNVVTGAGGGGLGFTYGGPASATGPAGSGGTGLDGISGGAGSDCTGSNGAAGGFSGGGGGGCSSSASAGASGGNGGFGGGGGGTPQDTPGTGGFGGGNGGNFSGASSARGGGGAGLGGAIFVYKDAALTIEDGLTLSSNIASGGSGANAGLGLGNDLFMMSGSKVTFNLSGNLSISTNIESDQGAGGGSGGGLVKMGSGTLTLGGINTYSGTILLNEGTLSIGNDTNLGASTNGVTFNGGTLQATESTTILANRTLVLAGPGTIDVSNGKQLTVNAEISGSGSLTKTSPGSLVLTATNTYTGPTILNGGFLSIQGAQGSIEASSSVTLGAATILDIISTNGTTIKNLSGSGAIQLGSQTLTINSTTSTTYDGSILQSGGIVKTGPGTLTLTNFNTYMGSTDILAGSLILTPGTNPGTLSSSTINVSSGAIFTNATPSSSLQIVNVNGTFNATAAQNVDTINLNGILNATGALMASTTNVFPNGSASVSGTGSFFQQINNSGRFTVESGASGTFNTINLLGLGTFQASGTITGNPTVNQTVNTRFFATGPGSAFGNLNIAGHFFCLADATTLQVNVLGGEFAVNGATVTSSSINVAGSGGSLSTEDAVLNTDITLSTGGSWVVSGGTTTLNGNSLFDASSNYAIFTNGPITNSKSVISGTAGLGNATLVVNVEPDEVSSSVHVILTANSGITGTFNPTIITNPPGVTYNIAYLTSPDRVVLTSSGANFLLSRCTYSGNQQKVGRAIISATVADRSRELLNVVFKIITTSCSKQFDSLNSISWSRLSQLSSAVTNLLEGGYASDLVYNHLGILRNNHAKLRKQQPRKPLADEYDIWAGGFAGLYQEDKQSQDPSFRTTQGGPLVAFDYYGLEDAVIGAAFAYGDTHLRQAHNLGSGTANSYILGTYGTYYFFKDAYLELALWGSYNTLKNKRNWTIYRRAGYSDITGTARSTHHAWQLDSHLALGYDFVIKNKAILEPFAIAGLLFDWENKFKETGTAPLLFQIHKKQATLFRVETGFNLFQQMDLSWGTFIMRESLSYVGRRAYRLGATKASVAGSTGESFTTFSLRGWKNIISPAAEWFFRLNNNAFFSVAYKGEFLSSTTSNEILAEAGYAF